MTNLFLRQVIRWLAVAGLIVFIAVLWSSLNGASAADAVANPTVTLQGAMVDIIGQATSGVKAGVAFLQQEIPDVVRQLLLWKAVQSAFWAVFYLVGVVIGFRAIRIGANVIIEQVRLNALATALGNKAEAIGFRNDGYKEARLEEQLADAADDAHVPKVILGVIAAIILGIFGIVSLVNIWGHALTVVQIYLAPKVWLIEYAASLIK